MQKLSEQELQQFYQLIELKPYKENDNKLEYLQLAMVKYQEQIPFSNIFLLSIPFKERKPLTFDEIKNQILTGQGGFCQVMNTFFYSFLLTIGYDVDIVNSSYHRIPNNHTVIIAKNVLKQGDKYLVDVGSGFYQSTIELNFEERSPTYNFLFTTSYFQWDDKKENINQFHINKHGESTHVYSFDLIPIKDFQSLSFQNHIYTDPQVTPFHNVLRIMRFPQTGAICIVDQSLLKENEEHRLKPQIQKFINTEEYLECVKKYFPLLDLLKCRQGYETLYLHSKD